MRYQIKQKIFSFGDNFFINDDRDKQVFKVQGKVFAIGDKLRIYDIVRMRNYLNRLNLSHGLIAYWSLRNLQLCGIYEPL